VLANKEYFIEKQGNYGSILTGHRAAAPRYIECRLTPLAREALFNTALTSWQASYDGRRNEPIFLPAKLPVALMLGCEGIAVGMVTKILPHNFKELLEAQIAILTHKPFACYPDFFQGGAIDVQDYQDGSGKIRNRATLEAVGDKRIIIREIPYTTTTESLIESIENAIQKGKVKISSIQDYTTDKVEIELSLMRGIYADEVIPQLYAYTDCEVSISSHVLLIDEHRHPREMTISEVLNHQTQLLCEQIRAELDHEISELKKQLHRLTLEQIFIEHKIYKILEKTKTQEESLKKITTALLPFAQYFIQEPTSEDLNALLDLKIRRIAAYETEKQQKNLLEIKKNIKRAETRLKNLTATTVQYLEEMIQKYAAAYPRRTKIHTFETIDHRKIARAHLKIGFDATTGYMGTEVKSSDFSLQVSEYDFTIAIMKDGNYAVLPPEKKRWLGAVLWMQVFPESQSLPLAIVYKNDKEQFFVKNTIIEKTTKGKIQRLVPKKHDIVYVGANALPSDTILLHWKKKNGQKTSQSIVLKEIETTPPGKPGQSINTPMQADLDSILLDRPSGKSSF
jgi:topoisomerase-4 subunit A